MNTYWQPDIVTDDQGNPRCAGFELEFGDLTVRETAEALHTDLGGTLQEQNPFSFNISGSSAGNLKIERDAALLSSGDYRNKLIKLKLKIDFAPATLAREVEQGIDRLSSMLIPCEIITEPLRFDAFSRLDDITATLNRIGAKGTQDSIVYAFGLHINTSAPNLEDVTLAAYMQAFLLLADWLIADAGIDFSRRYLTKFIDPFPEGYLKKVLNAEYAPNAGTFMDDYLQWNPTRNRALDLLPILSEIDLERVRKGISAEEQALLTPRPAFHYRLPDCRIGQAGWTAAVEWNRWWYIEVLAANNDLRIRLMQHWQEHSQEIFLIHRSRWIAQVGDFLKRHIPPPEKSHA